MKTPALSWCLGFAVISVMAHADDALPSAEDLVKELKAAYERNPGYIAIYQAKGENKALEYRVAVDVLSGLAASHLNASKGEEKMEIKIWNTDDDRLYVCADGALKTARGLNEEVSGLLDLLGKTAPSLNQPSKPRWYQYMLLSETGLDTGLGFSNHAAPWFSGLDKSIVKAANPETVTFDSKKNGVLVIDRGTGLIRRQSIKGSKGEDRVLELTDYKPNPGRKVIEAMSTDWPTLGAKDMNASALMAPMRLMMFQLVIDAVENGRVDLGKLETTLEEQKDVTRRFIKCCIASAADSPTLAKWRKIPLPDKEAARKVWLKDVPGVKVDDEEGFKKFLNSVSFRESFRGTVVDGLLKINDAADKLMTDLYGEGVWKQLKAKDETGQIAKDLLGKAVSRAFLEVMIERRMNEAWGNPEGLD